MGSGVFSTLFRHSVLEGESLSAALRHSPNLAEARVKDETHCFEAIGHVIRGRCVVIACGHEKLEWGALRVLLNEHFEHWLADARFHV